MGDGTKENPYTREDVLRLIKENGGTAKGLDLSGKVFKTGIDLQGLDLGKIILNKAKLYSAHLQEAELSGAHLEGSSLRNAHLERARLFGAHLEGSGLHEAHLEGAWLFNAHLERAHLWGTHFEGAHLWGAHLEGAILRLAKFSTDTELTNVDWGNFVIGEELIGGFEVAADTYRHLKIWHNQLGLYETAGEFFFREMTAKRNDFWWGDIDLPIGDLSNPVKFKKFPKALFPQKPFHWAWSMLLNILCGYGEKWHRVIISAGVAVFGLAAVYYLFGGLTLPYSLYYSAVSFTALGYGNWAPEPTGWVKGLGAVEAFIGVFMMALFLITFVRKMTR